MSGLSTTLRLSPPLQRHRRAVIAVLNTDVAAAVEVSVKVGATVKRQQSNVNTRRQKPTSSARGEENYAERTQNFNIQIKVAFKSNTAAIVATP